MFADERRNKILQILSEKESVTVNELTETLQFSAATLRADLNFLERKGLLVRTHGGAMLNQNNNPENDFDVREKKHRSEKQIIGAFAFNYIQEGQCILLDASSTCLELAHYLKQAQMRLTIVTNGLTTAAKLKENPNLTVIVLGGIVRSSSVSIEGLLGVELLNKINIDTLFTSAKGFSIKDGLTDFSVYEVELKKQMVKSAHQVIALLDHSKIGRSSIATFAEADQIDIIITDAKVPTNMSAQLEEKNIKLEIVD